MRQICLIMHAELSPSIFIHLKYACCFQEYLLWIVSCLEVFVFIYLLILSSMYYTMPIDYSVLSQFDAYWSSHCEFITLYLGDSL